MNTDTLMINIQSTARDATKEIDNLVKSLEKLQTQLSNTVKASGNFSQLKKNLSNATKGLKIDIPTPSINMDAIKNLNTTDAMSALASQSTAFSKQGSLLANFKSQLDALGMSEQSIASEIDKTTKNTNRGAIETTRYRTSLGNLLTVTAQTRDGLTRYNTSIKQTTKSNNSAKNSFTQLSDKVDDVNNSLQEISKNSSGGLFSGLLGGFTGLAVQAGIAWTAITKVATTLGDITMQAASYYETLNLFATTLGDKAQEGMEWVEMFSGALYLDPANVMQYMGGFNSLIKGLGVGVDDAYLMSQQLTQLTYDLASFKNLDFETAFQKLQSGISGEIEPLRNVGVALSEATLQELAYQLGIEKSVSAMSEAEKAQLRYIQIMRSSTDWQADMGKTLMSPANAIRVVREQFGLLARAIGNVFIPILMAIIPVVMVVTKALTALANLLADIVGNIFGFELDFSLDTSSFDTGIGDMTTGLEDVGAAAEDATSKLNTTLAPFDELNNVQTHTESAGSGAGAGGLGGGDLGVDLPTYDALSKLTDELSTKIDDLKAKFGELGEVLVDIWNSEPVQAFVGTIQAAFNFLVELVTSLGSNLYANMQMTWSNISGNVSLALSNIGNLWTTFWNDLTESINTWGPKIVESLTNLFNSIWGTAIDPMLQIITQAFADFSQILVDLWNTYGATLLDNIGNFVNTTIGLFQSIYDNVLEPIITPLLETLSWLWDEHLSKMAEALGEFIMKLVNGALEIYNEFVAPIISVLTEKLAPVISAVATTAIGIIGTVLGVISDTITSILNILGGVIDFIVGVFTGDWEKAWNGVKNIFGGIFNAIGGLVKAPINFIIDVLNGFIAGVNKIKIPEGIPGIGGIGFNIPKIKKFAEGGYPDSASLFFANENGIPEMIGRIGNQTAVANNDQITTAIASAVTQAINNSDFGQNGSPTVIYIGNKKVYEGYGQHVQKENDRYGTNMIRI